jgi:Nucleotidyltransferase domain
MKRNPRRASDAEGFQFREQTFSGSVILRIEVTGKIMRPDLVKLAQVLADWVAEAPGVPRIYLFGSRVRGDHRPDSDVDVRICHSEWAGDELTSQWWDAQNAEEFRTINGRLPGKLHIQASENVADPAIRRGAASPVYVDRKVTCVWTSRHRQ